MYNAHKVSSLAAAWGQFIAHDLAMTFAHTPAEVMSFPVPACELHDTLCHGNKTLNVSRNAYDPATGITTPRVPLNDATGFLDASTVYGRFVGRDADLRTFAGGRLKADPVNGVPANTAAVDMATAGHADIRELRLGGDERVNENPGLLSVHGLWVLEHNRLCRSLAASNPTWNDERLYNEARKLVIAQMQHITATEYAPILLGEPLSNYAGYNPNVNAAPDVSFVGAAYRYGHSGINSQFLCFEESGAQCMMQPLLLRDTYMQTFYLESINIAHLIRGMVRQPENGIDLAMVDDARNHLLGLAQDLAAIDIARCRDLGCPTYAQARSNMGLGLVTGFDDITSDVKTQLALSQAYGGDVNAVDLWVGGLAEPPVPGGLVGPTFAAIIKRQFENTRDGDRFWYENRRPQPGNSGKPYLSDEELAFVQSRGLRDVIVDNTDFKSCPQAPLRVPDQAAYFKVSASGEATETSGETVDTDSDPLAKYGSRRVQVSPKVQVRFNPIEPGDTHLEITAVLQASDAWVGIGLGTSMIGADIWTTNSEGDVQDRSSSSYSMPLADTQQDVTVQHHEVSDGVTIVTLRRALNTGDSQDNQLQDRASSSDATTDMLFAWGSGPSIHYHSTDRKHMKVPLHA